MDLSEAAIIKSIAENKTVSRYEPGMFDHEFQRMLAMIYVITSIKKPSDDPIVASLIRDCVREKYSALTLPEILTAFKMHASGELGKRFEHFQLVDLTFFTQVMNAYLEYRRTALQRFRQLIPVLPEPLPTPESQYEFLLAKFIETGEFLDFFAYDQVYDYMESEMMFNSGDTRKLEIYDRVKSRFAVSDEADMLSTDTIGRDKIRASFDHRVKAECRKQFVQMIIREQHKK